LIDLMAPPPITTMKNLNFSQLNSDDWKLPPEIKPNQQVPDPQDSWKMPQMVPQQQQID
jgi:hypothetical protein